MNPLRFILAVLAVLAAVVRYIVRDVRGQRR